MLQPLLLLLPLLPLLPLVVACLLLKMRGTHDSLGGHHRCDLLALAKELSQTGNRCHGEEQVLAYGQIAPAARSDVHESRRRTPSLCLHPRLSQPNLLLRRKLVQRRPVQQPAQVPVETRAAFLRQ
jgi:hypothetical protein